MKPTLLSNQGPGLLPDSHMTVALASYIASWPGSPVSPLAHDMEPWQVVARAEPIVRALLHTANPNEYQVTGEVAIHRSARVEPGAMLKGPLILGARCFVAAGALVRGGCWVDADCTLGPGAELKSSFVFAGSRLAHFNFVGDSVVGADVNLEAGSIICNHRNERADRTLRVRLGGVLHDIDGSKFGALIGDGCRLGANSVVAPGALLLPGSVLGRLALLDQELDEGMPAGPLSATRSASAPHQG